MFKALRVLGTNLERNQEDQTEEKEKDFGRTGVASNLTPVPATDSSYPLVNKHRP